MRLAPLSLLSLSLFSSLAYADEPPLLKNYQEPTRGFFLEHGSINPEGKVSIELQTGSDDFSNGGGIRLGLPNAELIINSGLNGYDVNEALVKFGLPDLFSSSGEDSSVNWAIIGGLANIDNDTFDQTNIKFGAAITVTADAGTFTFSPQIIYSNGDRSDETFFNAGLGAYVGVVDTSSGMFSLGIEANITTQDNTDDQLAFGARWAYNERVNIDIVPIILQDKDLTGLPGLVRLNVVF
mgnify:CR=1 FL=1